MKRLELVLLSGILLAGCAPRLGETPAKPVVDVKVVRAELADVQSAVRGPAFLFAREQANIGARIMAPISRLLVRKGDRVEAGQLLAELDGRDLLAQRDEAAAAVTDAEASLQRLAAGALPSDIERARGQAASAEAALSQAQKFYDRRRRLLEQGVIPQRDFQLSETELAQAKAAHEVAVKALDLLQNQTRGKEILIAASKVEQARARLAFMRAQLDFAEIRSASAGTITEQYMFPGDMARPDAPIFTVMDLAVVVARAQIPEADVGGVRVGQSCVFVPADAGAASFSGRITVVNQAVDLARRTVETWCQIPNPSQTLRAGIFGEVEIVTAVAPKSVVVPLAAVQFAEGSRGGVVMVAGRDGLAVKKDVVTGEVFGGKVQVKSGLQAGELVIVQGAYGLEEGTRIRAREDLKP